jgi:hypothetical protein
MSADKDIFPGQQGHDSAASEIAAIVSRFWRDEALSVIDLARARVAIQWAISDRIKLESREKKGL